MPSISVVWHGRVQHGINPLSEQHGKLPDCIEFDAAAADPLQFDFVAFFIIVVHECGAWAVNRTVSGLPCNLLSLLRQAVPPTTTTAISFVTIFAAFIRLNA